MTYLGLDLMIRSHNYLVLVTETVVAHDIAQTIVDYDRSAKVICANSMADAEAALANINSLEIAFVAGNPSRFAGSNLHRGLVERGCRIVLLGFEAEVSGPTPVFDVLPQPFDTAAVIAKLQMGHPNFA